MIRKIKTLIKNPKVINIRMLQFVSPILNDDIYLKMLFPLYTGYKLDLNSPITYNQKLQWLKINYRRTVMSRMVDKYEAKRIVADIIGEEYVIKSYGVWDSFNDIDFDILPSQFVLKTTHDQGGVVICKNKESFDYQNAAKKLNKHLRRKHFYLTREWPYMNVKPRILAEEYMIKDDIKDLADYKFFCFNGIVKAMFIATERQSGNEVKFDFFDRDFNHIDIVQKYSQSNSKILKPINFNKMLELAECLSKGFPHLRVDFYNTNGRIYFGEFTFYHHGGLRAFHPNKWDMIFGNWIDLNL